MNVKTGQKNDPLPPPIGLTWVFPHFQNKRSNAPKPLKFRGKKSKEGGNSRGCVAWHSNAQTLSPRFDHVSDCSNLFNFLTRHVYSNMQIRLSGKKQGSMKIWHFCKILAFSAQLRYFDHKSSGFGRLTEKIEDLVEKK